MLRREYQAAEIGGEGAEEGWFGELEHDPDRFKPRAIVADYVALVGQDVAENLEGLALARTDSKDRQYRDDATILSGFIATASGGGSTLGGGVSVSINKSSGV